MRLTAKIVFRNRRLWQSLLDSKEAHNLVLLALKPVRFKFTMRHPYPIRKHYRAVGAGCSCVQAAGYGTRGRTTLKNCTR